MKLNKKDLKKILYDFNRISSRLILADYYDYISILQKFVSFIHNTELINDYIKSCGESDENWEEIFQVISESYGHKFFLLGDTEAEEVRNIYGILCHLSKKSDDVLMKIAMGYSDSRKCQDIVKAFSHRVVMVLINHIEGYLNNIGFDMGADEIVTYSITVENGQVNIAHDNSTIISTNFNEMIDTDRLGALIQNVRDEIGTLSSDDAEILESSLELIEAETKGSCARKKYLKTAISALGTIKGTAELAAAITTLIHFIQSFL